MTEPNVHRPRRRDDPMFITVCMIILVVIFQVGLFAWQLTRSFESDSDRRSSQSRVECIARHQAVGLGKLVNALKLPPADATRNAKLTGAADELAKLSNIERYCH